jgi:hypothetical protein
MCHVSSFYCFAYHAYLATLLHPTFLGSLYDWIGFFPSQLSHLITLIILSMQGDSTVQLMKYPFWY